MLDVPRKQGFAAFESRSIVQKGKHPRTTDANKLTAQDYLGVKSNHGGY